MRELAVGIVGTGFSGGVHADAARRLGARLVAVSAATPESAARAASRLGAERSYAHAEALVEAPEVDVVHVCTPNHLHASLVERAINAGKHVVCEKPIATTSDDAARLMAHAQDAGVVAAVPFAYRYYPTAREARERARAGDLGRVLLIHGSYLQDWLSEPMDTNWRVDASTGGPSRVVADIGSHWCDMVEWVTGERITELVASVETFIPRRPAPSDRSDPPRQQPVDTEDAAAVLFKTAGGVLGSLVVSQTSPGRKNRLWFEIDGSRSSVTFDQEQPEWLRVGGRATTELVARDEAQLAPAAARLSSLPPGHPHGYRDCMLAFLDEVYGAIVEPTAEVGRRTFPTFADGARAALLTDRILASARKGSWIEVPA